MGGRGAAGERRLRLRPGVRAVGVGRAHFRRNSGGLTRSQARTVPPGPCLQGARRLVEQWLNGARQRARRHAAPTTVPMSGNAPRPCAAPPLVPADRPAPGRAVDRRLYPRVLRSAPDRWHPQGAPRPGRGQSFPAPCWRRARGLCSAGLLRADPLTHPQERTRGWPPYRGSSCRPWRSATASRAGTSSGYSLGYSLLTRSGVERTDAGFALATQGLGSAVVLNVIFWLALLASLPLYGFQVALSVRGRHRVAAHGLPCRPRGLVHQG